jgi:hypothetical protein
MMDADAVKLSMRQYLIPQESLCPSPLLEITNHKRKLLNMPGALLFFQQMAAAAFSREMFRNV